MLAPGIVVLKPPPAKGLLAAPLERVDVLVVNDPENELVTSHQLPAALCDLPTSCDIVVTFGDRGAVVREGNEVEYIAASLRGRRNDGNTGPCRRCSVGRPD